MRLQANIAGRTCRTFPARGSYGYGTPHDISRGIGASGGPRQTRAMSGMPLPQNHIGRLLHVRDWTDSDLASRTGIDRPRINRIKNRRVVPSMGEALVISEALGEPLGRVFLA